MARWQGDYREALRIALVSQGEADANQERAQKHRLEDVLIQRDREVSEAYRADATPSGVLIGKDGCIASPVAVGADAIRRLVLSATEPTWMRASRRLRPPAPMERTTRKRTASSKSQLVKGGNAEIETLDGQFITTSGGKPMDERFDRLSRAMAGQLLRRGALKLFAATVAGAGAAMLGLRPRQAHAACEGTCKVLPNNPVYCSGTGPNGCGGCGKGTCKGPEDEGKPCTC